MPPREPPQPYAMPLPAGDYRWCRCGRSADFPLAEAACEARADCGAPAFTVKPRRTAETLWLCGCGATKTPPFCDGSHNKLGHVKKRGWSWLA